MIIKKNKYKLFKKFYSKISFKDIKKDINL